MLRATRAVPVTLAALALCAGAAGCTGTQPGQSSSTSQPSSPTQSPSALSGTARYVALGDSYTSSPRTGNPAGTPPGCERSDNNYPHLVAAQLKPAQFADVSCSGAVTQDLSSPQQTPNGTNPPQLDAVTADTTLVTVGLGGNDVGFIALLSQCQADTLDTPPCSTRLHGVADQLSSRVTTTATRIANLLEAIHRKAPKAKIAVVGYPTVLPDGDGCWPFLPLVPADVAYIRQAAGNFNDVLRTQAEGHDATYVDTATPSKGHDMCQKAAVKWVEDLIPSSPALALHPNASGERAMADAVLKALG